MPHIEDLMSTCFFVGCLKRARYKVIGWRSNPVGKFCKPHADRTLADIERLGP